MRHRKVLLSLIVAWPTAVPVVAGDPYFVPGNIFAIEYGNEGCLEQRNWLREIDSETGQSWIFADASVGLCNPNGLRFTPRRDRLRVLNTGTSEVLDFDAAGSVTVVLNRDDGINTPVQRSGPAWDRNGFMYVSGASMRMWRYPPDGSAGTRISNGWLDSLVGHGNGMLYGSGGQYLVEMFPTGERTLLDDFGCAPGCGIYNIAHCVAVDRFGNLFVAVDMSATNGPFSIFRYDGTDPATRRLLTSGFAYSGANSITLSPDETQLYLATTFHLWAIDVNDGSRSELFRFRRDAAAAAASPSTHRPGREI